MTTLLQGGHRGAMERMLAMVLDSSNLNGGNSIYCQGRLGTLLGHPENSSIHGSDGGRVS